jgi:exodeoxyribonuclease VII small subunit
MNKKTYEESYMELEAIVQKLQQDNIDIDESIELFKRGIELQKYCNKILNDAEKSIVKILKENDEMDVFSNEEK